MKFPKVKLLVLVLAMSAVTSSASADMFDFSVDTTSASGQSGYIDLQFNPGVSSLGAASAVISNFASDATLGLVQPSGDVSGTLPAVVTLNNTTQFNDYFQALTFGTTTSFDLNLSGAFGNSFELSFFGADGQTPLLTTDQINGFATTVDFNQGSSMVTNSSSMVTVNAVPVPGAVWLFSTAIAGLGIFGRRKAPA